MSRPMSDLERTLLNPVPRDLDPETVAKLESRRCEKCNGWVYRWSRLSGPACNCKIKRMPMPKTGGGPLRGDEIARAPDGGPLPSIEDAEWNPPRRRSEGERLYSGLKTMQVYGLDNDNYQ